MWLWMGNFISTATLRIARSTRVLNYRKMPIFFLVGSQLITKNLAKKGKQCTNGWRLPSRVSFDNYRIVPRIIRPNRNVCLLSRKNASVLCVSDCPSSVTVSPSSGPYKAGDVLTCMSDGYPQPSYQWTDSHGVVVSNTNTITLLGSSFSLTCTATGNFATPCRASTSIGGNIFGLFIVYLALFASGSSSQGQFTLF